MIEKIFAVDAAPKADVQIQAGDVRIKSGTEGEIKAVVDARDESTVLVEQRGGTVVVRIPSTGWMNRNSAAVTLYVPEKAEVLVSTASAEVRVMTPLSELEVNTASGDVDFGTVGSLTVRTASGDITGDEVNGMASVATASGDVRIKSCKGKASFSSASGDVDIDQASGGLMKASTASGDVSIAICQSSEVKCKSMSGSVSLGFPTGTQVDLDVDTLSGKVRLPDPPKKKSEPVRNVSVKARLVTGDVTLFVNE